MAGNQGGRHRAPKPSRAIPVTLLTMLVAALLVAAVAVGWLSQRDGTNPESTEPKITPTSAGRAGPTTLESTRVIEVDGSLVTVRETTAVVEGGPVTVAPTRAQPVLGLRATATVIVGEDGTNEPFADPTSLTTGRSITVEGQYRLGQCPDLLPTEWPTPVAVVPGNWTRQFTSVQEPQRTARALCPSAKSRAGQVRGFRGSMTQGRKPTVRLRSLGTKPVTVTAIGAASGVAAKGIGRGCPKGCLAEIKPRSTETIQLRPLEACPVGSKTNQLTLRVTVGNGPPRTVLLKVPRLAQRVCD